jgi:hypothetical protein
LEKQAFHLEEAVEAYRAALQERTQERTPLAWANTQEALSTALLLLGMRTHDLTHLLQARDAAMLALYQVTQGDDLQDLLNRLEVIDKTIDRFTSAFRAS